MAHGGTRFARPRDDICVEVQIKQEIEMGVMNNKCALITGGVSGIGRAPVDCLPTTPIRLSALSASWMALRMIWTSLSTMPVSASAIPTGLPCNVSKEKSALTVAY
jgi:hypothetical protein